MLIARVIGELVATQKHASHEGRKVLLVQPLNLDGSDRGDAVVALDAVDAGVGARVLLVTEGFSAMTGGPPAITDRYGGDRFYRPCRPDAGSRVIAGSAARAGRPPSPPPSRTWPTRPC